MIRKQKSHIHYYEFEIFHPFENLVQGCLLRQGGVSLPPYDSLNLGGNVGDDKSNFEENWKRVKKLFPIKNWLFLEQEHKTVILEHSGVGDALVTNKIDHALVIRHADCQAALFYDPNNEVIAAVHAGWRGQVQKIYTKIIEYLVERYQVRPRDLIVGISPSLGPDFAEFRNWQEEFPPKYQDFQVFPNYFDLWNAAEKELTEGGVLRENIEIAKICTYSNPLDFFSYRRDKQIGRHATFIARIL